MFVFNALNSCFLSFITEVYEANIHYMNTLLPSNSKCFKIPSVQNLEVTIPLDAGLKTFSKLKLLMRGRHFPCCLAESNTARDGDKSFLEKYLKNIPHHFLYTTVVRLALFKHLKLKS